jgi:hypothetical protein
MADASLLFPTREGLRTRSRFQAFVSERCGARDLLILAGAGLAAAAATALVDFNWRIPGHAILRTMLPLSLGLALAPRRGSGVVMSGFAGLGMVGLGSLGMAVGGVGAVTSLLLTGPLLDLASRGTRRGWQIYLSFAAAGLGSNLAAFVVRYAAKSASGGGGGGGLGGSRTLADWQPQAIFTYAVCGLLAGLIGAAICFRATAGNSKDGEAAP